MQPRGTNDTVRLWTASIMVRAAACQRYLTYRIFGRKGERGGKGRRRVRGGRGEVGGGEEGRGE